MSDPLSRLTLELARLPGVGERTAGRLAVYLAKASCGAKSSMCRDLADALMAVADAIRLCDQCRNFSTTPLCSICLDPKRDKTRLCVVEDVADVRAIDRTGAFGGLYHVLHGALAPLDGIGPAELKLDQLQARVKAAGFSEVIVATDADVEGDSTALYIGELLRPLGVRLTRLASGVPLGGELEYLDQATLGRALAERREL